ncbi:TPA: hypothetical protein N0F65_005379, partial [Lagenidium giganteum]
SRDERRCNAGSSHGRRPRRGLRGRRRYPGRVTMLPQLQTTVVAAQGFQARPTMTAAVMAIDGKSLFTCHQCGVLLKFKTSPPTIQERIDQLRAAEFQEIATAPATTPSNTQSEASESAEANTETKKDGPQPASIAELVWEYQAQVAVAEASDGHDGAAWSVDNLAFAFESCNRSARGFMIDDVLPPRLVNKPQVWTSEWEVDKAVRGCDEEGWIYVSAVDAGDHSVKKRAESHCSSETSAPGSTSPVAVREVGSSPLPALAVRRRRLIRRRQIDGSDLSWFQELLDCSSYRLQKTTPSCHDCELDIVRSLEQSFANLKSEKDQYEAFANEFEALAREQGIDPVIGDIGDHSVVDDDDEKELKELEEEERKLMQQLEALEQDAAQLAQARREVWATGKDLEQLIHGTFAEGAFLQHLLGISRDERQSVGIFSVHASDMLRRLLRYNVCNDVFHIWHDREFGTINGLRLGRLPSKPVEWVEINAALGQAVLLLATIAERAGLEFTRNKLIPRGSFSRVVNMYGKEYSLFSDGGMFRRRGFNQAMILFLECVDDAGRRAMKEEPSLKFPYKIQRGKIGDLPISLGNDEQWTKALKFMLTHLKWLLAWVAKRYQ